MSSCGQIKSLEDSSHLNPCSVQVPPSLGAFLAPVPLLAGKVPHSSGLHLFFSFFVALGIKPRMSTHAKRAPYH